MKIVPPQLRQIQERLDRLPPRHRLFLSGGIVLLALFLWQQTWVDSQLKRRGDLQARIGQVGTQLAELRARAEGASAGRVLSPDQLNRREKAALEQEIATLDGNLQTLTGNMVSPREMASFLEELLRQEHGLRLVRLENLGAEPLLAEAGGEKGSLPGGGPNLYRHSLRLEFEGNYLRALEYLQRLEKMPKRLIWEELEIRAGEQTARIVLVVQTLSLHRGWIGG